jgi:hypothetical protein
MEQPPTGALDLASRRDLGAILNDAFKLYGAHFGLFATLAFGVVIPIELAVKGIGLGELWGSYDSGSVYGAGSAGNPLGALVTFVEIPLITAMHIDAVQEIAAGRTPTVQATARHGLAVFGAVLGTLLLAILGIIGGLLLLVIPGIYVAVRWFFASQVVVVEKLRFGQALRRSGQLVQGSWWRVLGYAIVFQLVLAPLTLVTVPFELAGDAANRSVFSLVGSIFVDGVSLSFIALTATLLYFDLRTANEAPPPAPPAPPTATPGGDAFHDRPEAPVQVPPPVMPPED